MYHALIWLLIVEVLGLVLLPLAFILFRRLPDRGLGLSKVLALLLFSYVLWLLGSTHLLPNTLYTIIAILAVAALASSLVLWRKLPDIASFLRREWPALLVSEMVFLGLYFLWLSLDLLHPGHKPYRAAHGLRVPQLHTQERLFPARGPVARRSFHKLLLLRPPGDGLPHQAHGHPVQRLL